MRLAASSCKTSVPIRLTLTPKYVTSLLNRTQQNRTITNATKIDHVPALLDVARVAPKEGGWKPTLIHSSRDIKFTVIRVEPGGEVPRHFHHKVWDYFIPLAGQAVIETKATAGDAAEYNMEPRSFLAVPPGDIHRVRNKSHHEEFVFLLAQSPRQEYDFINAQETS